MGESASIAADCLHRHGVAPPLNRIADHCAVFLDLDGTLVNLQRRPDQVLIDGCLLYLLDDLYVATAGATAILGGRSLEEIDALLAPLRLPLAGIYGAQRRRADGSVEKCTVPSTVSWQTRMSLRMRLRGDLEAVALASRGIFEVVEGSEVIELRPRVCDKGTALERFMTEPPFEGRFAIFIGNDQTDQAAFEAVASMNGMGHCGRVACDAPWWLPDPAAVRAWLRACLDLGN